MMKKFVILIPVLVIYLMKFGYGAIEFQGITLFSEKEISRYIDKNITVDSTSAQLLDLYRNVGYFGVEIVKIESNSKRTIIYISEGRPSVISKLNLIVIPDSVSELLGDCRNNISGAIASQVTLEKFAKEAIAILADNGMPFARGEWSGFQIDDNGNVECDFRIIAGPKAIISAIEFSGRKRTTLELLRKSAGLNLGALYSETNTRTAERMIDKMSYVEIVSPFYLETSAIGDSCVIVYNLKELPSTRFDGVGGFVKTKDKTDFIGRIEMEFGDILGTGRAFSLYWNKKDAQSNELSVKYLEPFILKSRMDLQLEVFQIDRDSLFVKNGGAAALYRRFGTELSGAVKFSLERTVPESGSSVSTSTKRSVGIEFDFDKTDFRLNPRSGYEIGSKLDYGYRSNSAVIEGENPPSSLSSAGLTGTAYFNPFNKFVTAFGFNGWGITTSNGTVPVDEYYFIGGANGLRGYTDQQFPAYRYTIATFEFRLITGKYSRAYLFGDFGFIKSSQQRETDYKFRPGYGFGLVSKAGIGIVKIEIAWGDVGFPSDAVFNFGFGGRF